MSYDEIEDPFEMMDEDEIEEYHRQYQNEVDRSGSSLRESKRDEVFHELQSRHNIRRSGDGAGDGRRNFLEAQAAVRRQEDGMNPHTKALLSDIDRRKGPGEGKKMLRKAFSDRDNAYFAQLKGEGHLND